MKKYTILALAVFMIAAFTLPAYALENEFGGYWDARFQTGKYYTGQGSGDPGYYVDDTRQNVASRTRLYYTAKINDNLKLVNKFEMDAVWGQDGSYGDIGADAVAIEVKNTYADFNVGPVNFTVGTQPYNLWRGYYIADDASGVIARWKVMDNFVLAASWLKAFEAPTYRGLKDSFANSGDFTTIRDAQENADVDSYTLSAAFWFSENISIKPNFNWTYSANTDVYLGDDFRFTTGVAGLTLGELNRYSYGFDFDMTYDSWGMWVTAIGQAGDLETNIGDVDFKGYLFALGGNLMLGPVELYAEGAYANGSDKADEFGYQGGSASHVWAELLSDGDLWNGAVAGIDTFTADDPSNLIYFGGGVKFNPMEKLTINPSVWYAMLDEDNATGDDEIGTEVDLKISYQLVEGLNLDLIGAYLFAGDAFSDTADKNEEDAYEYGMQLSLSF